MRKQSGQNDGGYADPAGLDVCFPMITAEEVEAELEGFGLSLKDGKTFDWLAMAVRRCLSLPIPDDSDGPERISGMDTRIELERLSKLVTSTWVSLSQCSYSAHTRLLEFALKDHVVPDFDEASDDDVVLNEPPDFWRYKKAVAELDWLGGFLRSAARSIKSEQGSWRVKERTALRVDQAYHLATVFEAAFQERVTANNYPNEEPCVMTLFMDFFSRMLDLTGCENSTENLSDIAKRACQLHRAQPVSIRSDVIPGL